MTVREVLSAKKETIPFSKRFSDAFGNPEKQGVWFIWGNSGNGKSSFTMQLCKELTKYGKVAYNSLEEGDSLSMVNMLARYSMNECGRNFVLVPGENMVDFSDRMSRHKSPDFYVIDSLQYTGMKYREYISFKEQHRDKLVIFISHADGKNPAGRSARSIMYDSSLKIFIEGYRAFSKGRFFGPTAQLDIWSEKAKDYWGEESEINNGEGI